MTTSKRKTEILFLCALVLPLSCAFSGIASSLLPNGVTSHQLFGLPLNCTSEDAQSSFKAQDFKSELLRKAAIILWDEASMIPKGALNVVDKLLRDLTGVDAPFGGKLLVLGGDFRQVLPVLPI